MASSVQFDSGNTRTLSPACRWVLDRFHNSGRWFFGSQRCAALRNEKMRSLARDFSSSRRAPPMAASNPHLSSACLRAWVFITSVCTVAPWLRSEEHTSELQSLMRISYAVFCLKKKNNSHTYYDITHL